MYCRGYVIGAVDTASNFYPGVLKARAYCVPVGTPTDQVTDKVVRYLEAHPEQKDWSAATEVLLALQQAYPCSK